MSTAARSRAKLRQLGLLKVKFQKWRGGVERFMNELAWSRTYPVRRVEQRES